MTCNANCRCCKGACCCGSQCTQETCQDCEDAHGVWAGPGTQCANEECDQPTGACCGESCAILSECECLQGGGEYQGDDTTCDPDPCGETVCSGPCDEENPCPEGCYCCDGQCQSGPCDPKGACCERVCGQMPACHFQSQAWCDAIGGVYRGDGTTCAGEYCEDVPEQCPTGQTCNDCGDYKSCEPCPCQGSCGEGSPCPEGCVCCNGQCVSGDSASFFCRAFFGNPCETALPVGASDFYEVGDFDCPEGFFKYYDGTYTQCTKCLPCPDGYARGGSQPDPQVWPCDCGGDCYQDTPASGPCSSIYDPTVCPDFCLCEPNPLP